MCAPPDLSGLERGGNAVVAGANRAVYQLPGTITVHVPPDSHR